MEAGLYLPVYCRCFRGSNSIFSLWRLSRFVTKLFKYTNKHQIQSNVFIHHISQIDSGVFTIKTINVKIKLRKNRIIYITRQSLKTMQVDRQLDNWGTRIYL